MALLAPVAGRYPVTKSETHGDFTGPPLIPDQRGDGEVPMKFRWGRRDGRGQDWRKMGSAARFLGFRTGSGGEAKSGSGRRSPDVPACRAVGGEDRAGKYYILDHAERAAERNGRVPIGSGREGSAKWGRRATRRARQGAPGSSRGPQASPDGLWPGNHSTENSEEPKPRA